MILTNTAFWISANASHAIIMLWPSASDINSLLNVPGGVSAGPFLIEIWIRRGGLRPEMKRKLGRTSLGRFR